MTILKLTKIMTAYDNILRQRQSKATEFGVTLPSLVPSSVTQHFTCVLEPRER